MAISIPSSRLQRRRLRRIVPRVEACRCLALHLRLRVPGRPGVQSESSLFSRFLSASVACSLSHLFPLLPFLSPSLPSSLSLSPFHPLSLPPQCGYESTNCVSKKGEQDQDQDPTQNSRTSLLSLSHPHPTGLSPRPLLLLRQQQQLQLRRRHQPPPPRGLRPRRGVRRIWRLRRRLWGWRRLLLSTGEKESGESRLG